MCRSIPLTQVGMISFDIDDDAPPPTCFEVPYSGNDPSPVTCSDRRKRSVRQPSLPQAPSRAEVKTLVKMAYNDYIRGVGGDGYIVVPGAPGDPGSFTAVDSDVTVMCVSSLISNYQCGAAGTGESNNRWTRISFTIPDVSIIYNICSRNSKLRTCTYIGCIWFL